MSGPAENPTRRPKLLILEYWGLGDVTLASAFIRAAMDHFDVTVVTKPGAVPLLEKSFPTLEIIRFDPPWTVFRGKYRLWRWPWAALTRFIRTLREKQFDVAVSVRPDPRDHLVMFLGGAKQRIGHGHYLSGMFLSKALRLPPRRHRVEAWRNIARALNLPAVENAEPRLIPAAGTLEDRVFTKPLVLIHPGARITVRRWPETYFKDIISRLREAYDFDLGVVVEPDGYGSEIAAEAQQIYRELTLPQLTELLAKAEMVICNDSGPGHIAAAVGSNVVAIFGPGDPEVFRPWGDNNTAVARDICSYRPCYDYCRYPEPYCLTRLTPDVVWPELGQRIQKLTDSGVLKLPRRAT